MEAWLASAEELVRRQEALRRSAPPAWRAAWPGVAAGGCFVCFRQGEAGPGAVGDPGYAGAALLRNGSPVAAAVATGEAGAPYEPGLLALREGALLEAAVRGLPEPPEVLLVNATGRDHPRRAGLAVHLGAILDLPTIGVTHRPLLAEGAWPRETRGAMSPLLLEGEVVGYWLRTRRGTRPLAVHAAWRTDPETAVEAVLAVCVARTPEPLRQARRVARLERARVG